MDIRLSVMLPEIVIISFHLWVGFNKVRKNAMRKKNPKQTKQILKSYRTQAEVLATVIYKLYRTISTVPDMRSQWGFQQFYPERVIQLSRPDGRSYWTFTKTRLELSRIATWFPTLRCKTEVSRAMEPF